MIEDFISGVAVGEVRWSKREGYSEFHKKHRLLIENLVCKGVLIEDQLDCCHAIWVFTDYGKQITRVKPVPKWLTDLVTILDPIDKEQSK